MSHVSNITPFMTPMKSRIIDMVIECAGLDLFLKKIWLALLMHNTEIILGFPSHQSVTSHATNYLPWWLQILWSILCNWDLSYDVLVYKFFFKLYDSLWKIASLICFYICLLIESYQHMKEPFPIELLLSSMLGFKIRYNISNIIWV